MARSWMSAVLAVMFISVGPALAERPPETKDDATHVVVGTVETVFVYEDRYERHYCVKIDVEQVERGAGVAEGDALFVECFQRKREAPRIPAAYGHTAVPKAEQKIRAWVIREGTRSEGIYKDWFEVAR